MKNLQFALTLSVLTASTCWQQQIRKCCPQTEFLDQYYHCRHTRGKFEFKTFYHISLLQWKCEYQKVIFEISLNGTLAKCQQSTSVGNFQKHKTSFTNSSLVSQIKLMNLILSSKTLTSDKSIHCFLYAIIPITEVDIPIQGQRGNNKLIKLVNGQ